MELDGESAAHVWPYRKAAWAVEDLEQDIGLVYRKMELAGLKEINNIGDSIGRQIEDFILNPDIRK